MNKQDETTVSGDSEVIRIRYDWSSICPSTAAIMTMAAATDCCPIDLDPLHGSIDPDALDEIVESMADAREGGSEHITFWHQGHQVAINPVSGAVSVRVEERPPN